MKEMSTENKIIEAAKFIFMKKGYAGTRTRDIAEEADINLALLNYHFGSKENLFKIVIEQKFEELFGVMQPILSNSEITLKEKAATLTETYSQLLLENEDLAMFVLNHIKTDKELLHKSIKSATLFTVDVIEEQLREGGYGLSVLDFAMNVISLSLFPFLSKGLFVSAGLLTDDQFEAYVRQRSQQIPEWIMEILEQSKDKV